MKPTWGLVRACGLGGAGQCRIRVRSKVRVIGLSRCEGIPAKRPMREAVVAPSATADPSMPGPRGLFKARGSNPNPKSNPNSNTAETQFSVANTEPGLQC